MKALHVVIYAAIVVAFAALSYDSTERLADLEANYAADIDAAHARIASLEIAVDTASVDAKSGKVGEKVVNLPQDGGKWHLTTWYASKNDAASKQLAGYFATDPVLVSIAGQAIVHQHFADAPDPVFVERYASKPLPGVLLQNSKGDVVYLASGQNVPSSGAALAAEIIQALDDLGIKAQDCPDGICPPPETSRRPLADRRPNRRDATSPNDLQSVAIVAAVIFAAALAAYALSPKQQRPQA